MADKLMNWINEFNSIQFEENIWIAVKKVKSPRELIMILKRKTKDCVSKTKIDLFNKKNIKTMTFMFKKTVFF